MTKKILVTNKTFGFITDLFQSYSRLIADTETNGVHPWLGDQMVGVSVTTPDLRHAAYFPFRHEPGSNLSKSHLTQLMRLLSNTPVITWFNSKFDISILLKEGYRMPDAGGSEDIMLSAHLLNENEESFKLKLLAVKYIDPQAQAAELKLINLLADRGFTKDEMWKLPPKYVVRYACDDVIFTEMLRRLHEPALRTWELWGIWQEVNDYSLAMVRMERYGMLLDVPLTRKYIKESERNTAPALKKLQKLAGYELNPRSHPQIHAFLGVDSATKDLLQIWSDEGDERATALLTYRGWDKVAGTYYRPFLDLLDEDDVLHPNILLHGTVAGRPSARKPPMQAIPRYTEVYKVKDTFKARPGRTIISADYSQMELRIGAHYAHDKFLTRAFRADTNIHKMTAKALGLSYDRAKRINFGVLYGVGVKHLAEETGLSLENAARYLNRAHGRHPNYRPLYNQMQSMADKNGYIRMWSGRVRHYNTTFTANNTHKALSNFIQGAVAEIMRYAITAIYFDVICAGLGNTEILLQVHDQILFESDTEALPQVIPAITEIMCGFPEFSIPIKVETLTGKRWGKLKEWRN